jgi:hypothetical protein
MRDMLFSMPLGPVPGERVAKPPLGPIPPQFKWRPVEGNPQIEINGLGQMRNRSRRGLSPTSRISR